MNDSDPASDPDPDLGADAEPGRVSRRELFGLAATVPFVLAACAAVGASSDEVPQGTDDFHVEYGGTRHRVLFDTAGEPTGDNLLAVVLLHGAARSGDQWTRIGLVDVLQRIELGGQAVVAVAPDLVPSGFDESFVTDSVIPEIVDRFSPNRLAVSGISRGGGMALDLALGNPDMFRSAGLHSPAVLFIPPVEPTATRFWLDIGDQDPLIDGALRAADSLQAAGVDLTEHTWPGDHVEAYWAEHLAEYFAFHLSA